MDRAVTGLPFVRDDGGRSAAGFKGHTGDCATRAIAIATGLSYGFVYDLVTEHGLLERPTKRRRGNRSSARTGVYSATMTRIMADLGWQWHPTMRIGSGTTVHLAVGELPAGRLVANVSRHYVAVIDGVMRDLGDPSRGGTRCVYGYWTAP